MTEARRWWLRVYDTGKYLIHESTCESDVELDVVLRGLEARSDYGRARVEPEVKLGGRETRTAAPVPLTESRKPACTICEMSRDECERRSATSGHEYRSGALTTR